MLFKPRQPLPFHVRHYIGAAIMLTLGWVGVAFCLEQVLSLMQSGQVLGRSGEVHDRTSTEFRITLAAAVVGVLMALAAVVTGARWFVRARRAHLDDHQRGS